MNWLSPAEHGVLGNLILSAAFIMLVLGMRLLLVRLLRQRHELAVEARRRWLLSIRNSVLFILLVGMAFIWANEIRTLAVSLLAIAVAIVIATKELILCFSGALLRTGANSYSLGDRIEIAGIRGDVIDLNLFAATVREIGPGRGGNQYTGRAVVIPHSLLLNNALVNETFMGDYVLHIFAVPWSADKDWREAERVLLEAARQECAPFVEEAARHFKRLEDRQGLEPPSVEPRVTLEMPEPARINLLVRIPAPARRQGRIEQAILRRFLEGIGERAETKPAKGAD